jgi:acetylornithine deacetylase/succinyl-diaminopimelate desuccinylase-like protein
LLYAHHDVQPVGRLDKWQSPPFEAVEREGRLYGRGSADDKAGLLMHLAAIDAYQQSQQKLPVNIKFIVEGEEEIGSENLSRFLNLYQEKLHADCMILTDTANLETGLPSMTYQLRGLLELNLSVKVLKQPVHSGMWGGPVIDAISVLSKLLGQIYADDGSIQIPGFYDGIEELTEFEKINYNNLPFDETQFRRDLAAVENLDWVARKESSLFQRIWSEPAIAVLGIDCPKLVEVSNQIVNEATAKISIRIVPGQDIENLKLKLSEFFLGQSSFGAEVTVEFGVANPAWKGEIEGPAFDAAKRALKKAYDRDPVFIGCGGSIPFVKPMTEAFPNMPALLIGVEDPQTNAHGENESLHIDDWKKGIQSAIYLYEELSDVYQSN